MIAKGPLAFPSMGHAGGSPPRCEANQPPGRGKREKHTTQGAPPGRNHLIATAVSVPLAGEMPLADVGPHGLAEPKDRF